MNLIEKIRQIEHVDFLIRKKSTGSPKNLSKKLGISERQVYNIINTMKEMGAPIYFCSVNQCYCYEDSVKFQFGFITDKNE
jgi:predicted DNA-binding transcriptional regulator YafY